MPGSDPNALMLKPTLGGRVYYYTHFRERVTDLTRVLFSFMHSQ